VDDLTADRYLNLQSPSKKLVPKVAFL